MPVRDRWRHGLLGRGWPEYLVRYHASNTLLRYAGDPVDVGEHPTLFDRITTEESAAAARSAWQQASDELAAAAREAH